MLKSTHDLRKYHTFPLSNGLEVLLIQDQKVVKSAVSLSVAAGHFEDPEDCHGLAHLLEHMMFLGSQNFAQPNGINDFCSTHGGNINAWTGTEYANYHFEVTTQSLDETAIRFADMLANPLFDLNLIEKEIQSIDAEFKLKQKDDLRRLYQVHKETCNPAHPFSKFSVGNAETLGGRDTQALKEALTEFHNLFYVAKNCRLCVISELDIEQQKKIVESAFSILSKAPIKPLQMLPPLYLEEHLGVLINIEPIKAAKRLIVTFALPEVDTHYRTKPVGLISHIIGDEGDGSLLQYLKNQNLCSSLSAGGGIHGRNFKDFNINLQLTSLGLSHVEKVLSAIFSYIQEMRQHIRQDWRYQEKILLNQQAFDFSDAAKAVDDVSHYAEQMFYFPNEHIVAGDYLLDRPNFDVVDDFMAYLIPQNMRVKLIQPGIETDKKAAWYQTPYKVEKLPEALIKKLSAPEQISSLSLPRPNPYLMEDTGLTRPDLSYQFPKRITQQPGLDVWFGQDHKFLQPKGDCFISFDCEAVSHGIEISAYKRLWVAMMMEQFNREYYQAGVAGLHFHLYAHQAGFSLHTNGFSQKQLHLCEELVSKLILTPNKPDFFDELINKQSIALQNTLLNKPINRLFNRLSVILQRHAYSPAALLPVVQDATFDKLLQTKESLMQSFFIESFVHGDFSLDQANALSDYLSNKAMSPNPGRKIIRNVADLRAQQGFIHAVETQHEDAAVVVYLQSPTATFLDVAKTILLEQLLSSPFFSTMRTQKQLGYMVGSGYMPFSQHPGMAFYIQSPNVPASQLVHEIKGFIEHSLNNVAMFEPIWKQVKYSVIKQLEEKDTNLTVKSQRYWMAIGNEDHEFEQASKLAHAVQTLEFVDVIAFCSSILNRENVGELVLYSQGKNPTAINSDAKIIQDLAAFKDNANYII